MYDLRVPSDEETEEGWEKVEDDAVEAPPESHQEAQGIIRNKFPELAAQLLISYGSYVEVVAPLHQTASASSKSFNFVPNRGATTLVPTKYVLNTSDIFYTRDNGYFCISEIMVTITILFFF